MIKKILEKYVRIFTSNGLTDTDFFIRGIKTSDFDKLEKELTEYKWQLTRQEIKEEYMNDTVLKYRGNGLWEEVRKDDGWIKEHKEWIKRKEDEIRQN